MSKTETKSVNEIAMDSIIGKDCAELKEAIQNGADVNYQTSHGETPLFYAMVFGNQEALSLLTKHGADAMLKNKRGNTTLEEVAEFFAVSSATRKTSHEQSIKKTRELERILYEYRMREEFPFLSFHQETGFSYSQDGGQAQTTLLRIVNNALKSLNVAGFLTQKGEKLPRNKIILSLAKELLATLPEHPDKVTGCYLLWRGRAADAVRSKENTPRI